MRPIIEFCTSNLASGTDEILPILESNFDLDVVEYGCLGNCGECFSRPFAYVDGQVIAADTPAELLEKIREVLKESHNIEL